MFGAFPPRYLAAVMGGAGMSGALTSTLQMIVRGALQNGYEDVRTQSKIYYGLSVGIQATTFICLILFRWNSFAQRYVACFQKRDQYLEDAHDVNGASLNKIDVIPGIDNLNNNGENGNQNVEDDR